MQSRSHRCCHPGGRRGGRGTRGLQGQAQTGEGWGEGHAFEVSEQVVGGLEAAGVPAEEVMGQEVTPFSRSCS